MQIPWNVIQQPVFVTRNPLLGIFLVEDRSYLQVKIVRTISKINCNHVSFLRIRELTHLVLVKSFPFWSFGFCIQSNFAIFFLSANYDHSNQPRLVFMCVCVVLKNRMLFGRFLFLSAKIIAANNS